MTNQELLNHAIELLKQDKVGEAEHAFNYLLDVKPDHPDLIFYVATCFMKRGYLTASEMLFRKNLEIDPESVAGYNNLGFIYKERNKMKEAEKYFKKAIEVFPDIEDKSELSTMWNNLATTFVNMGSPEKAIEYCNEALKLKPDNTYAHWNKSLALLEKAEWVEGWKEYESGFNHHHKRKDKKYDIDLPMWDGTKGKKVVVYGEQGMGDEIMFMSMLEDLTKDCEVVYDAHPRLADIARNSFDFPVYGTRKSDSPWVVREKPDYKLAIGSLGKFYRKKTKDFPGKAYLKADEELIKRMKDKMQGNKLKVGISWKGGYKTTRKDLRSVTLDQLKPILEQDCDFYSLQYTEYACEEVNQFKENTGIELIHWQEEIDDYDLTAAMLTQLDLVISVCTSIIHLSGAMGVPCWVLTPSRPAWRYLVKGPMPWYKSVRLFRQKDDDWDTVIKQVKGELCSLSRKTIAA